MSLQLALPGPGPYELHFDEEHSGFLVCPGGPSWLKAHLPASVHDRQGQLVLRPAGGGVEGLLDHTQCLRHDVRYVCFRFGSVLKRLRMKVYRCSYYISGAAFWFELRLLQGPLGLSTSYQASSRWISDQWSALAAACAEHFPAHLMLRKAFDRRACSTQKTFDRNLPEAVLSTAGLLLVLAWRAANARPLPMRDFAMEAMEGVLKAFFSSEDVVLHVAVDRQACTYLSQAHPVPGAVEAPMDDCEVWVQPLLHGAADSGCKADILKAVRHGIGNAAPVPAVVPVWRLLQASVSLDLPWLTCQLVSQLSQLMEQIGEGQGWTQNPLDLQCDYEPDLANRRPDTLQMESLALGHGATGSEVVTNAWAHARSFAALRPKLQKVHVAERQAAICQKHLLVGRLYLAASKHLCIPSDGTRVGGKDILTLAAFGEAGESKALGMWLPPQASCTTKAPQHAMSARLSSETDPIRER